MRLVVVFAVAYCALAAATTADAQTRRAPSVSLSEAAAAQDASQQTQGRRGLRWNENGRWGLNFNMNQPVGRESSWGDVEAGAYYRLSPRLRVGAAAAVGSPETDPARAPETDRRSQSRFRLETIFKF
jgi:hypothetical protein